VEISNQEMEKKITENFSEYVSTLEETSDTKFAPDFFQVYQDLQMVNGRQGSEIFYSFLNKVFDRTESEIEKYLSRYLSDLWISKMLGK
jgi:transcription termination factor NusB